jgi:hypothetical protein
MVQRQKGLLIASCRHLKQLVIAPFTGGRLLTHAICILSQRIAARREKVPGIAPSCRLFSYVMLKCIT